MGTYKFIQGYIGKKERAKDQQVLQAIVDILFDGNVDENLNITINGLRKDFSRRNYFTVFSNFVLIDQVDIVKTLIKLQPVEPSTTVSAINKLIEQTKDKYQIKVLDKDRNREGFLVSGFTEEELEILRQYSNKPKKVIKTGWVNHKFAVIEKDTKPGSNYLIFDSISKLIEYRENILDTYGIETEVYHVDMNDVNLDKVNVYSILSSGVLRSGYYITAETLPMKKVEFKPFSYDYDNKSVFEDVVIVAGVDMFGSVNYHENIKNFIKNHGGSDVNGFTPMSVSLRVGVGCDYLIAYKKPSNEKTNFIPFVLFQEFINSNEHIKRVINGDIVIYIGDLKNEFLEFIKHYDNPNNIYGLTEKLFSVKKYIEEGIIGEGYIKSYLESMCGSNDVETSKVDFVYNKYTDKAIFHSKKFNGKVLSPELFLMIKEGQDIVYGDVIEHNTDFDENETIGVFINSVIARNKLVDEYGNYHHASIACSKKLVDKIVNDNDYSSFNIRNELGIRTYQGEFIGIRDFEFDTNLDNTDVDFNHQVKFFTIKELLDWGHIVSRLDENTYAVSGFTDLDSSLIKEYKITRL